MTDNHEPISPPPETSAGQRELPAYVSNGLVGLRVRDMPLRSGMALVNGYSGQHPLRMIEAAAVAPYPLAGDMAIDGVWLSDCPHQVTDLQQAYDFATGELTSRFTFRGGRYSAEFEVVTFASREDPTLVCQDISFTVDGACDLLVRAAIDATGIGGRALSQLRDTPGESKPCCDGALMWESPGGLSRVGLAYISELTGGTAAGSEPQRPPLSGNRLHSTYEFRARTGQRYRMRQVTSVVCDAMHSRPDQHAARMVAKAKSHGSDKIRADNRAAWREIWKGRIQLVGADKRWQALADAAFFYLNCSVHASSPASTSIFGMATWHDYHYYFGHVMWDIEAFAVPVLAVLQPAAAESLLDYRVRTLEAARRNAQLSGRRGLQFAWESAPRSGDEAAPLPGTAAWHEDHVSLDVARAFALFAELTGDTTFLRNKAWPVLSGVATWIKSRATARRRSYAIGESMGIAERKQPVENAAFTNMACVVVLGDAVRAADRISQEYDPAWSDLAKNIMIPRRGKAIVSHEGYKRGEEKGATPDPLMGIWPFGFQVAADEEAATAKLYLDQASDYLGSPMLSALYGVWAARSGDRRLALRFLDEGYGQFVSGRFAQTLEYRSDKFTEQPRAGPFFANMGGFLMSLLFGFTGLKPNYGEVETWSEHPAILPEGWRAIEVERVWVRGKPMKLSARHGQATKLDID